MTNADLMWRMPNIFPAYGCHPSCGDLWVSKLLWMHEETRAHWNPGVQHLNLVADDGVADGKKFCFSIGYSSELDEGRNIMTVHNGASS